MDIIIGIQLLFFFMLGSAIGSFLNVCIARLPENLSVVTPGSHCLACNSPIKIYDNIPILSFIILKGRCRSCKTSYSVRYLAVELITGIAVSAFFLIYGFNAEFLKISLFFFLLLVTGFIDYETGYIPTAVIITGSFAGIFLNIIFPVYPYLNWIGAAAAGALFLWLMNYAGKLLYKQDGMGSGDVILAVMMGIYLGAENLVVGFSVAFVLTAAAGIFIRIKKGSIKGKTVPFGPFLAAGSITAALFGKIIINWYKNYLNI